MLSFIFCYHNPKIVLGLHYEDTFPNNKTPRVGAANESAIELSVLRVRMESVSVECKPRMWPREASKG